MLRKKPAVVLLSLVILLLTAGTAYALNRDDPRVKTADEVYSKDMSLEEISKLSQGEPGTVAPPCPAEADVTKLKEADRTLRSIPRAGRTSHSS